MKQRISIKDVDLSINGKIVGGAEECSFTVSRDNEEAYEGGNYTPVEIVGGKFHVAGSLTRAFVDVDLLNELQPKQAIPISFTLSGSVVSGKTPGRSVSVFGAVVDSIDINGLGLDGYAKNSIPFKALDWKFS